MGGQNLFSTKRRSNQMRNKNKLPLRNVLPKANDFSGLLGKGVSESEIILAGELFKRQMAEKQRRRRPNAPIDARDGYDVDFLYYLYRNRFQIPTDLLYYRYNAGRVPSRGTSTGINSVFDPIDPSTPDIFDYITMSMSTMTVPTVLLHPN